MYLSVIIPTRNRAPFVSALLDSLAQQNPVAWDWEVVVIDNGSTDDTEKHVKQKQRDLPVQIRYILEERPGLHQGRNRGAREAVGKYLAYLDDDMLLDSTWLEGVSMLERGVADAVVGRIVPQWEIPPPTWLSKMCESGVFDPFALLDLGDTPQELDHHFNGCNLFIQRETVLKYEGFNPDGMPNALLQFRGDGETGLWLKMKNDGLRLWYEPKATAYHIVSAGRISMKYLRERGYRQGISQSFTEYRMLHGVCRRNRSAIRFLAHRVKWLVIHLEFFMRLNRLVKSLFAETDVTRECTQAEYEMLSGFRAGWKFHRKAIRECDDLRQYVLRDSFFYD